MKQRERFIGRFMKYLMLVFYGMIIISAIHNEFFILAGIAIGTAALFIIMFAYMDTILMEVLNGCE